MIGKIIHFLNDFDVNLALIRAIGILYFLDFKIKFGHISESTRKILSGFHRCKNYLLKKAHQKEKIYVQVIKFF